MAEALERTKRSRTVGSDRISDLGERRSGRRREPVERNGDRKREAAVSLVRRKRDVPDLDQCRRRITRSSNRCVVARADAATIVGAGRCSRSAVIRVVATMARVRLFSGFDRANVG